MYLAKWKKNTIFEAIVKVELDPEHFDLDPGEEEWRLEHIASGPKILISEKGSEYGGTYLVAGEGVTWPYDAYSWNRVIDRINSWLKDVKRDIETPDLWAQLRGEARLLGSGPFQVTENTPFTPHEQEEIAKRLQELSDYVKKTYAISEANALALDAKIDYLTEAARRAGRIDWRVLLIGSLFDFLSNAVIESEAAREIFRTFVTGTADFFGNAIQVLPIG